MIDVRAMLRKYGELYAYLIFYVSYVQSFPKEIIFLSHCIYRPLAGYGLPPPRENFVDHIFLIAQCLARILQHVSILTMAALSGTSLLHTLPYKIFDNSHSFETSEKCKR